MARGVRNENLCGMTIDFDAVLYRPLFETFGVPASYTPPGGGPFVPCTIIRSQADRELSFGAGKTMSAGDRIEVRAAEVTPAAGGIFVIREGDDAETVRVIGDPIVADRDPFRLAWVCTVSKVAAG